MRVRGTKNHRAARRAGVAAGVAAMSLLAGAGQAFADSASLSVTTTTGASDPVAGVSRIFTLSGTSGIAQRAFVKFRAPGGAPCAPSASQDSGAFLYPDSVFGGVNGAPVNGAYSFQTAQTVVAARSYVFCYWLAANSSAITTPFTQTITFRPPTGTITATINPITPQPGQVATATVTGASESPAYVYAKVRPAGGAGCAATFASDAGEEVLLGKEVDGAFSLPATVTQTKAGSYVLCLWLAKSSSDPAPIAGPQPQPFNVVAPPPPPPPPPPPTKTRVSSRTTLKVVSRRSGRYSGRVTTLTACRRNRIVNLRRVGSGSRVFASTRTRADGTYSLNRSRRLKGSIYSVVKSRPQGLTTCLSSASPHIRG